MRKASYCVLAWLSVLYGASGGEPRTNGIHSASGELPLVRTAAAPFGASGSLALELTNSPAGLQLVLTFELQSLPPGRYRIEVVTGASELPGELGFFEIRDPDAAPDLEAGDSFREDSTAHQSYFVKSRTTLVIPVDGPLTEIRSVRLTDMGGTVLLEGKRSGSQPGYPAVPSLR